MKKSKEDTSIRISHENYTWLAQTQLSREKGHKSMRYENDNMRLEPIDEKSGDWKNLKINKKGEIQNMTEKINKEEFVQYAKENIKKVIL